MQDWLACHAGYNADNMKLGRIYEVKPDGQVAYSVERWAKAQGSYSATVQVCRDSPTRDMLASAAKHGLLCSDRNVLKISGNPVKYLQGHNVFGPSVSQLGSLTRAFVQALPEGLRPADAGNNQWPAIHRSRVDITSMIDLGSHRLVHEWLRHAETETRSRHGRAMVSGSTVYWGKHSRRWSMKAYCKFCELAEHKPDDNNFYNMAREWCEGQLRLELTLRTPELKDKGTLAESLVWDYMNKIEVGVMNTDVKNGARPKLKPQVEAFFSLWASGSDVRMMLPKRTLYRYRRIILDEVGVDISLPRREQSDIEREVFDLDYLKAHEVKGVPTHLQGWLLKLPASPMWPAH